MSTERIVRTAEGELVYVDGVLTETRVRTADGSSASGSGVGGGSGILHSKTLLVPHADILTLPTLGVELVAAPGDNLMHILCMGFARTNIVASDYETIGAGESGEAWLSFRYGAGPYASTSVYAGILLSDAASGSGKTPIAVFAPGSNNDFSVSPPNASWFTSIMLNLVDGNSAVYINQPLTFRATNTLDQNFSAGHTNNVLRLALAYLTVNTLTGEFV